MRNSNDVRNIYEAQERERELIHIALFPGRLAKCAHCRV